ncbi:MAG: PEP-CTERM sorting domain-containing protein [Verrucomicrobiae bacterium]|nr:PEP-CTERM sorting domain-containing protein [Verrucomicrobiae bacterium]
MKRIKSRLVGVFVVAFLLQAEARAAALAYDDANDPIYTGPLWGEWQTGENGGFGFGPWELNMYGPPDIQPGVHLVPHYIGTSENNAVDNRAGIDVMRKSFALYGSTNVLSEAIRPFIGDLSVGQSFIVFIDNGRLGGDGRFGVELKNALGEARIGLLLRWDVANYLLRDATGTFSTGLEHIPGMGYRLEFALTGPDTMTVSIQETNGVPLSVWTNRPLAGTAGSGIDRVRFFVEKAGITEANEQFFNRLAIIPEPVTSLLVLLGLTGTCFLLRRRGDPAS